MERGRRLRARRAHGRVIPVGVKSPRAHTCGALGRPRTQCAEQSTYAREPFASTIRACRLGAALSRAARDGVLQELAASMSRVRWIPREASPQKKGRVDRTVLPEPATQPRFTPGGTADGPP